MILFLPMVVILTVRPRGLLGRQLVWAVLRSGRDGGALCWFRWFRVGLLRRSGQPNPDRGDHGNEPESACGFRRTDVAGSCGLSGVAAYVVGWLVASGDLGIFLPFWWRWRPRQGSRLSLGCSPFGPGPQLPDDHSGPGQDPVGPQPFGGSASRAATTVSRIWLDPIRSGWISLIRGRSIISRDRLPYRPDRHRSFRAIALRATCGIRATKRGGMPALGYNVWLIRWVTFVVSGFWGGFAGVLYADNNQLVSPHTLP